MSMILGQCPNCKSGFLIIDSETGSTTCLSCNRMGALTPEELEDAKTARDQAVEKYYPLLEKA